MKVAAIQMVSGTDLPHNLQQAHQLLQQAAHAGAELAVLPEYFAFMGQCDTDKLALQEAPGHGPVQDFLARTARELQLWLVGGTLPLASAEPRRASNSALAYNPAGECVARYDKIHLFCYDNGRERYDEAQTLVPGQQPTAFGLTDRSGQAWRIGLSVCYDLRFAELYRQLQADVLLVPAAFTHTTGQAHWDVLLRARHRKPGLRAGQRPGRPARQRQAHLGPQPGGRPLGPGAGPARQRPRPGAGRAGHGLPATGARPAARAAAPPPVAALPQRPGTGWGTLRGKIVKDGLREACTPHQFPYFMDGAHLSHAYCEIPPSVLPPVACLICLVSCLWPPRTVAAPLGGAGATSAHWPWPPPY